MSNETPNTQNIIPEIPNPEDSHAKKVALAVIIAFCLLIFGGGLFHFVVADKDFSESENRVLAKAPVISFEKLKDGSFMSEAETYLTDQFPFRDVLISAKTFCDRLIGIKEENGVYIGSNGFIFDTQTPYTKEKGEELTGAISDFAQNNKKIKTSVLIAPNSSYVYRDYLPGNLDMPDQSDMLKSMCKFFSDRVNVIDTCESFRNASEGDTLLYYRTDHHWTTDGAYVAFEALAKEWKLDTKKTKLEFYTVSTTFEGTLSSKAGLHTYKDEVKICVPEKSEGTYFVSYESQGKKTATIFEKDKLNQKNHYEVFLGGNYDKVIISTVAETDNTLLLVKDSYANCLIPMLTPYFSRIVVVDPRYLTDSFGGILKEYTFTHALFLYNMNTLLGDTSLAACLAS